MSSIFRDDGSEPAGTRSQAERAAIDDAATFLFGDDRVAVEQIPTHDIDPRRYQTQATPRPGAHAALTAQYEPARPAARQAGAMRDARRFPRSSPPELRDDRIRWDPDPLDPFLERTRRNEAHEASAIATGQQDRFVFPHAGSYSPAARPPATDSPSYATDSLPSDFDRSGFLEAGRGGRTVSPAARRDGLPPERSSILLVPRDDSDEDFEDLPPTSLQDGVGGYFEVDVSDRRTGWNLFGIAVVGTLGTVLLGGAGAVAGFIGGGLVGGHVGAVAGACTLGGIGGAFGADLGRMTANTIAGVLGQRPQKVHLLRALASIEADLQREGLPGFSKTQGEHLEAVKDHTWRKLLHVPDDKFFLSIPLPGNQRHVGDKEARQTIRKEVALYVANHGEEGAAAYKDALIAAFNTADDPDAMDRMIGEEKDRTATLLQERVRLVEMTRGVMGDLDIRRADLPENILDQVVCDLDAARKAHSLDAVDESAVIRETLLTAVGNAASAIEVAHGLGLRRDDLPDDFMDEVRTAIDEATTMATKFNRDPTNEVEQAISGALVAGAARMAAAGDDVSRDHRAVGAIVAHETRFFDEPGNFLREDSHPGIRDLKRILGKHDHGYLGRTINEPKRGVAEGETATLDRKFVLLPDDNGELRLPKRAEEIDRQAGDAIANLNTMMTAIVGGKEEKQIQAAVARVDPTERALLRTMADAARDNAAPHAGEELARTAVFNSFCLRHFGSSLSAVPQRGLPDGVWGPVEAPTGQVRAICAHRA